MDTGARANGIFVSQNLSAGPLLSSRSALKGPYTPSSTVLSWSGRGLVVLGSWVGS